MNKTITFCGNILVDSVKTVASWPERGMLAQITDLKRAVGGSVCNTGVDLKTLDPSVTVRALGKVGADDVGDFAVSVLESKGVDCSLVRRIEGVPTTFTDVMTVAGTGERTFFNMHGADSRLTPDDVDVSKLDCDIFHLGYLLLLDGLDAPDAECGTQAARLLRNVQAAGIKTSVDIVSEQSDRFARVVRPALRYCDYIVVNEIEGSLATGIPCRDSGGRVTAAALTRIAEELFALGVREKVVLHCPEMSVCRSVGGETRVVPSLDLPSEWIKGSVGAGDAFCAGVAVGLTYGKSLREAVAIGTHLAASVITVSESTCPRFLPKELGLDIEVEE